MFKHEKEFEMEYFIRTINSWTVLSVFWTVLSGIVLQFSTILFGTVLSVHRGKYNNALQFMQTIELMKTLRKNFKL